MQVYLIHDPKYPNERNTFRNYSDIEPSIRISWGACQDVKIVATPKASGGPVFTITGKREGEEFTETLTVERLSVWDSPTHL